MKGIRIRAIVLPCIALGLMLSFGSTANAAACTAMEAAAISGSVGCEVGNDNNDFMPPEQVNTDALFGITDWQYAGKINFGGPVEAGDIDIGLMIAGGIGGDPQSGTWSIDSNAWSLYSNIMIVLKGGGGGTTQENYIGYLLDGSSTSGTYDTPFFNPSNRDGKDISHITLYATPAPIPVPAALPLFASALLASGWFARRRRS